MTMCSLCTLEMVSSQSLHPAGRAACGIQQAAAAWLPLLALMVAYLICTLLQHALHGRGTVIYRI